MHHLCQSEAIHLAAMMVPFGLEEALEELHAVFATVSGECSAVVRLHCVPTLAFLELFLKSFFQKCR
jgi:hypothetical protein